MHNLGPLDLPAQLLLGVVFTPNYVPFSVEEFPFVSPPFVLSAQWQNYHEIWST